MGNYQSSTNQFYVMGDGNSFNAEGGMSSTNAASLDLKAGKTNPGGRIYVMMAGVTGDSKGWSNLQPVYGLDGQLVVVLTTEAVATFGKFVNLIEMYRPLLDASQRMTCYKDWHTCITLMDGYVGVSPQSAINNFVKSATTINLTQLRELGSMFQNILGIISSFDRDIQSILTTIPNSVDIGQVSGNMHSILDMMSKCTSPNNICALYPEAALTVIRNISPTIRRNQSDAKNTPIVEGVNMFEPVFNGTGPQQPPLTNQNEGRDAARTDAAMAQISLITSSQPIDAKALKSGTPSKEYKIRLIDAAATPWVSSAKSLPQAPARIQFTVGGVTMYAAVNPLTRALHLDDMTSMAITLDVGGESYYYDQTDKNPLDPDKQTLVFLLFKSTIPLEEITTPKSFETATVLASESLRAAMSSVQKARILANTNLHYDFVHDILLEDSTTVNHYLMSFILFKALDVGSTYPQGDAWAGITTMQSLDADRVTVKGMEMERVIPSVTFGNYTPAEQVSALPNDIQHVMSAHLAKAGLALNAIDDEDEDGNSTAANAIYGNLIVNSTKAVGPVPSKDIDYPALRKKANLAVSSFKRDPEKALRSHDQVLGNSEVMFSLLDGVGGLTRTKGLSTASKDSRSALTAAQSGQQLKQRILDKVTAMFPPQLKALTQGEASDTSDMTRRHPLPRRAGHQRRYV